MADSWSILGLRADTADEKQVRTAYARLLKVHRPDQDPEGFQQLRTAYEQALEWLRFRDVSEEDDQPDDAEEWEPEEESAADSDPAPARQSSLTSSWADGDVPVLPHKLDQTPPPEQQQRKPQRPERNWPREWSYSIVTLDRAMQDPRRYLDIINMALRALAVDVQECGIPPDALECIISDAFATDAGLFGMTVPVNILSCLMQGNCIAFLNDAMDALEQADKPMHIIQLAQKFDECAVDALSPVTVDIFFRVAGMVAMHNPFVAKSIGRKLRRLLDDDAHLEQFDRLHAAIMRGMAFRDLVPEHRGFWSQRLDYPDVACDWTADFPRQALAAVFVLGKRWVGFSLVHGVVPEEVWKNAAKGRWIQFAFHRVAKRLRPNNPNGMMFAVIGGVFLFCGMKLFDGIVSTLGPAPMSAEQIEELKRDHQREVELVRKHYEELKQRSERTQSGSK